MGLFVEQEEEIEKAVQGELLFAGFSGICSKDDYFL